MPNVRVVHQSDATASSSVTHGRERDRGGAFTVTYEEYARLSSHGWVPAPELPPEPHELVPADPDQIDTFAPAADDAPPPESLAEEDSESVGTQDTTSAPDNAPETDSPAEADAPKTSLRARLAKKSA